MNYCFFSPNIHLKNVFVENQPKYLTAGLYNRGLSLAIAFYYGISEKML